MKEIAINYNLIFCMTMAASPIFKLLATALKAMLCHHLPAFRQKDEAKQNKAVLNLLKGIVYLTILLDLLPYLGHAQKSFGQFPTWLGDHFQGIIYTMLLIPMLYSYELTSSPKIPWTMWLHHGAPIAISIIGLSKGLVGGGGGETEQETSKDESSSYIVYLFCYGACLAVSLDCVFYVLLGFFYVAERARTKALLIQCAIGPYCCTCTSINVATLSVLAYHREFLASSPALAFAMWSLAMLIIPEQVLPLQTLLSMAQKLHKQAQQEALNEQKQACTGKSSVFPQAGFERILSSCQSLLSVARRRNSRCRRSSCFQTM